MRSKIILTLITMLSMFSGVRAEGGSSVDKIEKTIVDEINSFITFIMDIVKQYLIEPPVRVFKNLFEGISTSIGAVGVDMFSGVRGVMDTAWQRLADFLSFTGPLAPIIASAVIWVVVVLTIWVIIDVIADFVLPSSPLEEEIED